MRGPNRSGENPARLGGAASAVIPAARSSPIAGEDEKPEPLQPLATHSPGTSDTGPARNRPSGLMREQPAPVLGDLGAVGERHLRRDLAGRLLQRPRSSGTSSVREGRRLAARVERPAGSASNTPTISPPRAGLQVRRRVDHPDDGVGRPWPNRMAR